MIFFQFVQGWLLKAVNAAEDAQRIIILPQRIDDVFRPHFMDIDGRVGISGFEAADDIGNGTIAHGWYGGDMHVVFQLFLCFGQILDLVEALHDILNDLNDAFAQGCGDGAVG